MTNMLFSLISFTLLVTNVLGDGQCSEGWSLYEADQTCIKLFDDEKTFEEAKGICSEEQNGHLVIIKDGEKNDFVTGLTGRDKVNIHVFYIGVHGVYGKNFTYVDGSKLVQVFGDIPTGPERPEFECVVIYINPSDPGYSGEWGTEPCYPRSGFICESGAKAKATTTTPTTTTITTTKTPEPTTTTTTTTTSTTTTEKPTTKPEMIGCPEGWFLCDKFQVCLKAFDDKKETFGGARSFCQEKGGDLVTLLDNKEQRNIVKSLTKKRVFYWIGIHDLDLDGRFTFVNGNPVGKFQPFKRGEPNNKGNKERCVEMRNGKWFDKRCNRKRNFVCQMNLPKRIG